ncbi:MAG: hypothetical protein EA381_18340 [Planctomycetaceae bacterium]|nr:MAG: hypothetical protein EA381_18340 [Planctomycetaceae bacterium]
MPSAVWRPLVHSGRERSKGVGWKLTSGRVLRTDLLIAAQSQGWRPATISGGADILHERVLVLLFLENFQRNSESPP